MLNLTTLGAVLAFCALPFSASAATSASTGPVTAARAAVPVADTTVKLATLVPSGSVWDKAIQTMGSDWKSDTDGRVKVRIYPSGSVGDEPDIVRKMRIGQIHAASLTMTGLGNIDTAFRAFQIPMYYASEAEARYVVDKLMPVLEQRLADKGFVFLHWAPAGWIYLFSKQPVSTPDDLRKQKQFLWAGETAAVRWWEDNDFQPVPLASTDIPMGLTTGLIEAVPAPPLSALAFQWFRSTPYMMDLGAVPYLGATVMTQKAWDKLSAEDQAAIRAASTRAGESMAELVPAQERQAIEEMKKRGLTVTEPDMEAWQTLADRFAEQMGADAIPAEVFELVEGHRRDYRARTDEETSG